MRLYTIYGAQCLPEFFTKQYDYIKKYCTSQNNLKDKDKEKDAFIGPKEFILHMMTQTKDISYSTNENNSTKSTF